MTKTLIKTDKNGTKHYRVDECPKCGGTGRLGHYFHIDQGICYKCGGSGKAPYTVKEYTPEYQAELDEKRLEKEKKWCTEHLQENKARYGFETDNIYVVLGNTYHIREELNKCGAKYDGFLGWYFNKPTEKYKTVKVNFQDLFNLDSINRITYRDNAVGILEQIKREASPQSKHLHNVGDKIEIDVTVDSCFSIKNQFGSYPFNNTIDIYRMLDEQDNVYIWKTTSITELKEGKKTTIKATVKANSEYKGEKQTELIRCKEVKNG